jgi:hypothetical protein
MKVGRLATIGKLINAHLAKPSKGQGALGRQSSARNAVTMVELDKVADESSVVP